VAKFGNQLADAAKKLRTVLLACFPLRSVNSPRLAARSKDILAEKHLVFRVDAARIALFVGGFTGMYVHCTRLGQSRARRRTMLTMPLPCLLSAVTRLFWPSRSSFVA